jgi:seryl-tRNA synthetase
MLDIKFIRQNPEKVKEGCRAKQVKVDIDRLLEVDKKRREVLQALEDMRAQKNKATKEIQRAKDLKEKEKIVLKMRELDKNSDKLGKALKELEEEFNDLMLQIPNLPLDDVPVGKDEKENAVLREVGEKTKFDLPAGRQGFQPKDYLEIAENLDLIDVKRAAKVAGTRFGYIKREAVLLEFALINLAFDTLTKEGFIPVLPPVMLKPEMARGMGYLEQSDKEEAYFLPQDNLYLVGTAEQSTGTMHTNEIFNEKDLPRRYVAFSTCFRREAGSYGKDTKGIFRVHQFDKVEMFSFTKPEDSIKEHKFFLEMEEKLMQSLKIPYRVVNICTGDLGRPAAAKYDIEAWFPSQNRYRETHSTSNCTDFQARRLNIRYRDSKTKKLEFVHTLNGTAFAIGRTLIAIIENYQQKDGSILIPAVLQPYLNNLRKIERKNP